MRRLPNMIAWAEEHTASTALLVGDYLQRHNEIVFERASADDAERRISKTVDWVLSEIAAMRAAQGSSEPIRTVLTRDLAADPEFPGRAARFSALYEDRRDFREKIDMGVASYLKRRKEKSIAGGAVWQHCISYQTEELAMFEMMVGRGYATLIYPGPHLPVMIAIVSEELKGISPALESINLVELRFAEERHT